MTQTGKPPSSANLRRRPIVLCRHNEKGDIEGGNWHAERALEYSDHTYRLAKPAHTKLEQRMTSLIMSTRCINGSHYENHQRAANLHGGAAHGRAAGKTGSPDAT